MDYSYMEEGLHDHVFSFSTTCNDEHRHCVRGETAPGPDRPCHVHTFQRSTTCDDGHLHYFCGVTGPAVPVMGGHIHEINGATTYDCGHNHAYNGRTCRGRQLTCAETPCRQYPLQQRC